jgi:hypothetical protein
MAEYKVSHMYDMLICRLLSYLYLEVCDLTGKLITVLWVDILSTITV